MNSTREKLQIGDITIARLFLQDIPLLRRILCQHVRDSQTGKLLVEEVASYLTFMAGLTDEFKRKRTYFVARSPLGVLGCMGITSPEPDLAKFLKLHQGEAGELVNAFVDREVQGMGVGRRLFMAVSDEARRRGHTLLTLSSGPRYEKSWPFYDAMCDESPGFLLNKYGPKRHAKVWTKRI